MFLTELLGHFVDRGSAVMLQQFFLDIATHLLARLKPIPKVLGICMKIYPRVDATAV